MGKCDSVGFGSRIFNRDPQSKSFIPRTPKGKPKSKPVSHKPRYIGPVYLPKHIYDMLSDEVKKELDKCNNQKKANYQPHSNRMAMDLQGNFSWQRKPRRMILPSVHKQYECQRISHAVLIANGLVLIELCNENHLGHVPIAFWVIIT